MIELIERTEAFAESPRLWRSCREMQDVYRDHWREELLDYEARLRELADPEADHERIRRIYGDAAEMAAFAAEVRRMLDDAVMWDAVAAPLEPWPDRGTLTAIQLPARDLGSFPAQLGAALAGFSREMGAATFVVAAVSRTPWTFRDPGGHAPLTEGIAGLRAVGVSAEFDGALRFRAADWETLAGPFFWIARCLPESALFFFAAVGDSWGLHVTKHGGLYVGSPEARAPEIVAAARRAGFDVVDDVEERLSPDGAIEGRSIET